jgi:RHS repeat-associated protein
MKAGKLVGLIVLVLLGTLNLFAQATPDLEEGMRLYGSYHGGDLDHISLSNGNLFFHADLMTYSQRGKLAYPIVLQYNSENYNIYETPNCPKGVNPGSQGCPIYMVFGPPWIMNHVSPGNSVTIGAEGLPGVIATGAPGPGINTTLVFNGNPIYVQIYSLLTSDGSLHALAKANSGTVTLDGSDFVSNGSVIDGHGTNFSGGVAEDANGNEINFGTGADTLGRSIPPAPGPAGNFAGTPPASTASLSACPALGYSNQPVTAAYTWNLPTTNGGLLPLILCYASVYVRSGPAAGPGIFDVHQSFSMLQSVVLPDNTYWAFEYDAADPNNTSSIALGDLLKVTLPTGGSISYTWSGTLLVDSLRRSVMTRSVDANDGNGPRTWNYNYSGLTTVNGNLTQITTVTDPLGNDVAHTMTGLGGFETFYETETQYFQGAKGSGALLKTSKTDYQFTANQWDPSIVAGSVDNSITNVFPIRVTTTLPNGLVSKVETDYDSGLAYHGPLDGITYTEPTQICDPDCRTVWGPPITNPVTNYTGSYGKVTAKREYDWGQDAPGTLLRQTETTYQWQVNSAYQTANMLNLPAVVKILDGSNNLCAETDYFYDESTYLTTLNPAITTQHVGPPAAVRGNLTTVTRKLSATPCSPNATWSSVSSHTNWFDTGEVYQSIDPLNHTTTHTYDPAYAGAYPTQIQLPDTITNGVTVHHVVSGTYDFDTGLPTSFTDANNQTSNYSYDNRWRMTSAVFPADSSGNHPETDFQYPNVTTVQRSKKQAMGTNPPNSISWIVDYAYFDGVGRTTQTRLVDPAGDDFVDTTYDAAGRVNTVSNPHRSTASATDGVTTPSYDALGRVKQTTAQDGSISTTDYSNFPTVTVTDPAGKTRRSRTDALGRLVEVDEPGPGADGPGTPGSGSINVSGSLYSSTSSGTKATGWFIVGGAEQSFTPPGACYWVGCFYECDPPGTTYYDQGSVNIGVNGWWAGVVYDQYTTGPDALAGMLAGSGYLGSSASPVTPSYPGSGTTVWLTAKQPGPNPSLAQIVYYDTNNTSFFTGASFTVQLSGSSLTGGVYPVTTYDSGTVSVTVSGSGITSFTASASYNQSLNNTAQLMASALASALSASNSPVTASPNGTTINITAKGVGVASDLTITGSSTASFTASNTTLSNGTNPGGFYAPYVTTYSYDPVGNLLQVNQAGDGSQAARVRSFTYDSFSRLLTAHNPESGTICYGSWSNGQCVNGYDADGNLLYKTSPQANQTSTATTTISYCYDSLNRMLAKQYTNSGATLPACGSTPPYLPNPAVTYSYDSGTNAIGRLSSLTDQAGSGSYSYDPLGRMSTEQRTINGGSKSMGYSYNLDGSLQALTYPSTRVVNYTYNTAGQALTAIDGNGTSYVGNATHWPSGQEYQRWMPVIYFRTDLNKRLQPSAFYSDDGKATVYMSRSYTYNDGSNNGDVMAIANNKDTTRSQAFTYDQLNRVSSASDNAHWGNTYGYDAWGNLLQKAALGSKPLGESLGVSADVQNRLHVAAGADYQYDAAGNMTYNASGMYYSYDQENRITGAGGYTYVYDADGNRVEKTTGGSSPSGMVYWYMAPGIVAESDLSGNLQSEYVFFEGGRVARIDLPGNTLHYYLSDHLQSTSMLVSVSGAIEDESDYYPYGGERQITNTVNNHYKFTGKERDIETGLDYFGARYYSNVSGRFVTPDKLLMGVDRMYEPQRLNLYSYASNNPVRFVDPTGRNPIDATLLSRIMNVDIATREAGMHLVESLKSNTAGVISPQAYRAVTDVIFYQKANHEAPDNAFAGGNFDTALHEMDRVLRPGVEDGLTTQLLNWANDEDTTPSQVYAAALMILLPELGLDESAGKEALLEAAEKVIDEITDNACEECSIKKKVISFLYNRLPDPVNDFRKKSARLIFLIAVKKEQSCPNDDCKHKKEDKHKPPCLKSRESGECVK